MARQPIDSCGQQRGWCGFNDHRQLRCLSLVSVVLRALVPRRKQVVDGPFMFFGYYHCWPKKST